MQQPEYKLLSSGRISSRSPVQTALATVAGTALVAVGLAFAFAASLVVLTVGAIGSGYVLWKTRAVRRALREQIEATQQRATPTEAGNIVEGEVIREDR